eukprot:8707880-Alexandrium_andersonii.AAC.1
MQACTAMRRYDPEQREDNAAERSQKLRRTQQQWIERTNQSAMENLTRRQQGEHERHKRNQEK